MKVFMLGLLLVPVMAAAEESPLPASCVYDLASGQFRQFPASEAASARGQALSGRAHLLAQESVAVDGLRYVRSSFVRDTADNLNAALQFKATVDGVHFYTLKEDPYIDLVVALGDAESCTWAVYDYRPELHFAWMEEKSLFMDTFVFKHPALAVDPASFKREGERVRGIGFEMIGHPHKGEDGKQPLYYRTYVEADCPASTMRVLDQRTYGPEYELVAYTTPTGEWHKTDDVYAALRMLATVMCEVPESHWSNETRLPGDIHDFSAFVHYKAHEEPAR